MEEINQIRSLDLWSDGSSSLTGLRLLIELASCLCQSSSSLDKCSKAMAFSELEVLALPSETPEIGRPPKVGWSTSRRSPILCESCSFSRLSRVFSLLTCSKKLSSWLPRAITREF